MTWSRFQRQAYWTIQGQLALDIDQRQRELGPDTVDLVAANPARARQSLGLPYMAATPGAPLPVKVTVSTLTVEAKLLHGADDTARLRLPSTLELPDGRHPVTLPKADTPVAYAVVDDGTLLRLEGPAYEAGRGRRFLDAVGDDRRVRRVRGRLGR